MNKCDKLVPPSSIKGVKGACLCHSDIPLWINKKFRQSFLFLRIPHPTSTKLVKMCQRLAPNCPLLVEFYYARRKCDVGSCVHAKVQQDTGKTSHSVLPSEMSLGTRGERAVSPPVSTTSGCSWNYWYFVLFRLPLPHLLESLSSSFCHPFATRCAYIFTIHQPRSGHRKKQFTHRPKVPCGVRESCIMHNQHSSYDRQQRT
jgi:hypothetical protein